MSKRATSPAISSSPSKRLHTAAFAPRKIASVEAAAAVDSDPPLAKLLRAVSDGVNNPQKGESFLRTLIRAVTDNRALWLASAHAKKDKIPLVVLFILSPQDYVAHDRGPRRIDFTLRNLALIKASLAELHIPLLTISHPARREIPEKILSILESLSSSVLYANIEYEVDELRCDLKLCKVATPKGIKAAFIHDKCVVEPGVVLNKDSRSYAVYTPYQKVWLSKLNGNLSYYLEDCPKPHPNDKSVRASSQFKALFETPVPESLPGFTLDAADQAKMKNVWPAGETVRMMITLTLTDIATLPETKSRSCQLAAVDPLGPGAEISPKRSRVLVYDTERDRADRDTTSRISPYLAAGILSERACIRATMSLNPDGAAVKVDGGKTTGIGRWVQEIAWRDFYTCILAGFPRVSMGRPFLEKFTAVVWEEGNIAKWKAGQTGVPIVDAAMRCINEMGWVHNRMRMISAMFLVKSAKDLMVDWRVGERYFMEKLIDGDLASNNGGWQWSASTGVDPCPYFRIFNPYTQSSKADPTGDFIRHYVPELAKLRGPDLYKPCASVADKLGYPRPIVKHDEARHRAMRRFKNPGTA
ncbi:FAD binding domain of DNA photolyase-domain-containing protein [Mycena sp. CBHHK59/15]|nr:FAD binding domain of DNA photolyase-domain-containing protein [Mycena sp. CBHHK59/15]